MDIVASYLQQQQQRGQQRRQDFFLPGRLNTRRSNNSGENSNDLVAAAVSSMVDGAAAALRSSRRSAERSADEARAVATFALSSPSPSSSSSPFPSAAPFAALIPGNSPAEIVFTSGISSFLSLYNAAIVGRLLLSWWPQAPQAIVSPLATLTDPYLGLFRGIIPPLGGTLDLSPILAFVTLDLFTNAAAALPCEMPRGDGGEGAAATSASRSRGRRNAAAAAAAAVGGPRIPPRPTRWRVPSLVAAARKRRSE